MRTNNETTHVPRLHSKSSMYLQRKNTPGPSPRSARPKAYTKRMPSPLSTKSTSNVVYSTSLSLPFQFIYHGVQTRQTRRGSPYSPLPPSKIHHQPYERCWQLQPTGLASFIPTRRAISQSREYFTPRASVCTGRGREAQRHIEKTLTDATAPVPPTLDGNDFFPRPDGLLASKI